MSPYILKGIVYITWKGYSFSVWQGVLARGKSVSEEGKVAQIVKAAILFIEKFDVKVN